MQIFTLHGVPVAIVDAVAAIHAAIPHRQRLLLLLLLRTRNTRRGHAITFCHAQFERVAHAKLTGHVTSQTSATCKSKITMLSLGKKVGYECE